VGQTLKRHSPAEQERLDKYYEYASTPVEMDPRLAEIKRSYAASTDRLVNSPEEAERAWKWWQKKIKNDPRNKGGWNNDLFERINSDPVERAAALRRMQEIVKTDPQQGMSQREVVAHALNGQGDLIDRALQSIKQADRGTPLGPMTLKPPKPSTGTPVLPLPTNLLGHGIAGGIGGAGIGAMINAVKGRSIGRGAVTGGITGAGALSGMGLGANLSRHPAAEFTGGWAGLGGGGYGGYQLAQYLQGAEEEDEEEAEEELNKLSEDAGYSPKAQAGGKVKGFPKTTPGVPQVPSWGSDKATRMPKATSLGPVKAQSQAKKQFPTKDPILEMPEPKLATVVDPIARLLAITKTSTSNTPKRRRKGAPRSVTIKKPARTNPDTGEVTPGSSHIKHIARAGKKLS
jgi:hypothetical protein